MMQKCESCMNSRAIISENGLHYTCTLSPKKAVLCIMGNKDEYCGKPIKTRRTYDTERKIT